jgi:hypothetical protein
VGETITEGYGTCPECGNLKHVTPEATVRLHNRYQARGAVVAALRCAGSGEPSVEETATRAR